MCEVDFDNYCTVWNETEHRAKKRHVCNVCHAPINPGDIYTKHFSVFDAHTESAKVCALCQHDRDEFMRVHGAGYAPSGFTDGFVHCYEGANPGDPLAQPWRDAMARYKMRRRKYPRKSPRRWAV